jgi:hypothetical protein
MAAFSLGTANAYGMDEGCYYENHPILFDHGISTGIPKSGSWYWFPRVRRVGGLCRKHRDQHSLQSVSDHTGFCAIRLSESFCSRL